MESAMIPYFAHEGEMCRMERTNKRLWILILVLIVALIGSNAGWIYYESQFVDTETTVEQQVETDDGVTVVSGIGDAVYGESDTADYSTDSDKSE